MVSSPEQLHWQRPDRTLDVSQLERELDRLFHEGPFTRASMLNLIAVCSCGEEISRVMEAATQIVAHHPARVLLLDFCGPAVSPDDPAVTATISATCFRPTPHGEQICCEVITLRSSSGTPEALASAVLPLLVPDLPVLLWWSGDVDLRSPLLGILRSSLDGIIPDLRRLNRWNEDLRLLTRLLNDRPMTWVGDLCWFRLQPWRKMTSRIFDPAPCRIAIPEVRELHLRFQSGAAPGEGILSDSLLYTAWVTETLDWKLREPVKETGSGRYSLLFRRGEEDLPVFLEGVPPVPAGDRFSAGTLLEVTFQVRLGDQPTSCSIRRDTEGGYLVGSFLTDMLHPATQSFSPGEESTPALLCQALEEIGQGSGYARALERVTRMVVQK